MNPALELSLLNYVSEVLGIPMKTEPWDKENSLPPYLSSSYHFRKCEFLNRYFLLFFANTLDLTPASAKKHLDWIEQKYGYRGILVQEATESYNRKRLIERRIPFIIPKNQMYIPDLGLDLQEHFKKLKKPVRKLSPSTQVMVLGMLNNRFTEELGRSADNGFSQSDLVSAYGYSRMTVSRATEELRNLEFLESHDEGRYTVNFFTQSGRELWLQAKPYLQSPVSNRIYANHVSEQLEFISGETALSHKTMLAKPRRDTWAMNSSEWRQLQSSSFIEIIPSSLKESAPVEIEIWRYSPALLADPPFVDPFSLALSLEDVNDERVEMAIDEMFERCLK